MQAIILSVGDELVLGQTVDTNSAWLSQQLAAVGCAVAAHATLPDDQPSIERAIAESALRCDVLIISGGIGPTEDDLTRQALAAVMNQPLELNEIWLKELDKFFKDRGRVMPPMNRIQAMIPRGATMIFNRAGTAAGIRARISTSKSEISDGGCEVFVMPGVPKEMKTMFTRDILPYVAKRSGGGVILSRTLHTFGLGESTVAERLGTQMMRGKNPSVGTTVSGGVVSVRVNARFASIEEATQQLENCCAACDSCLGDVIYGKDNDDLPTIVGDLLLARPEDDRMVATAESMTGGLLAKMLTDVPGSGGFFGRGWVVYEPSAKKELLGVPSSLIKEHGLTSEPVAIAMATGARVEAEAAFGLGITGLAGPNGGNDRTPVGTCCIGLSWKTGSLARTFNFPGDREMIRDRAAKMALTLLRYHLLGKPTPF